MLPVVVLIGVLTVLTVSIATPTRPNIFSSQHLKITQGNDTEIIQHPWQVSLQIEYDSWCSGFLISRDWVLTSAYCVFYFREDEVTSIQIRAGSSHVHEGGQLINVQDRIVHPEFYKYWFVNDIALLRLAANVTDPAAKAVQLPEAGQEVPDDTVVTVAGWGLLNQHGGIVATVLQEIQVPTVNRTVCQNAYTVYTIFDYMFCAGFMKTGGEDACGGDEGSPATIGDLAVGIATKQMSCGSPGFPGLYIQISNFRDWIRENSGI